MKTTYLLCPHCNNYLGKIEEDKDYFYCDECGRNIFWEDCLMDWNDPNNYEPAIYANGEVER